MKTATKRSCFVLVACHLAVSSCAAGTLTVGNKYINAVVDDVTGMFTINDVTNPASPQPFLFQDGHTSHSNFLFHVAGAKNDIVLSNAVTLIGGTVLFPDCASYIGPDSVRKNADTITSYYWKFGYLIRERLYPVFGPNGISGQIIHEYISERKDSNTANLLLGILWEADVALNSNSGCSTGGDHPIVLTSEFIDATPNMQTASCWNGMQRAYTLNGTPDIPDYFHAASTYPGYDCPQCDFLFARLRGPGLTTPDEFYVGEWGNGLDGLKDVCWNVAPPNFISSGSYLDNAVIYKWNVTKATYYRIATAYGEDDPISDLLICKGNLFKEIHYTTRFVRDTAGNYTPPIDTVRVYVINVNHNSYTAKNIGVTMDLSKTKHLYFYGLPTSQKTRQESFASPDLPSGTGGYVDFLLVVDPTTFSAPGIVDTEQISTTINLSNPATIGDPGYVCPFSVIVPGAGLPPRDTLAPVVTTTLQSRYQTQWLAQDSRPHDTGVDSIESKNDANNNFTVSYTPFTRCDPSQKITITAAVVDTSKPGCVNIRVVDCAANDTSFTLCYMPRIDSLPPLVTLDSATGIFSGADSCNGRCRFFTVRDNRPTDYGMGTITATNVVNFDSLNVNNGAAIPPNSPSAAFSLCVVDSMRNAHADVVSKDFVGNTTTTTVDYCSIQDSTPPAITITKGAAPKSLNVTVTETHAWDRGLSNVYLDPSSLNVRTIPATITWTRDSAAFIIEAVDTVSPASFTICAQDSFFTAVPSDKALYYAQDPNLHQTCRSGDFSGNDTIPPNIIVTPLGNDGARVQVNDIHYINGVRYSLDKGIQNVVVDTSDVVIDSMFAQPNCDSVLYFRLHVRDTLAFCDTLAYARIIATDCAFNVDTLTWYYSLHPDTLPPLISAVYQNGIVTVNASDSQQYDRGLGNVDLSNTTNVAPYSSDKNDGRPSESFPLTIVNSAQSASATLTVTDRTGAYCTQPQRGNHTTVIQFQRAATSLALGASTVYENDVIAIPLLNTGAFANASIASLDFDVRFDSTALDFVASAFSSAIATASPLTSGTIAVHIAKAGGITDADPMPALPFRGLFLAADSAVVPLAVSGIVVNGGVPVKSFSADGKSFLLVPPAAVTIDSGAVTVQKRCERTGSSSAFALGQNYPNPYNGTTSIPYSIPGNGRVRMTIYNIFGVEIAQLLDEEQRQGAYVAAFDSRGLREGTYFYKLDVQCQSCGHEDVAVKRMAIER